MLVNGGAIVRGGELTVALPERGAVAWDIEGTILVRSRNSYEAIRDISGSLWDIRTHS